jgi:hypothetical protein
MERKTITFSVKQLDEDAGVFEGYASTFSQYPDAYGDIVDPGAFAKTLKEGGKRVKILWNHNVQEPIGKPLEMREDENGLYIKGKLSLGVQRAREVLSLMKDGVINEMSIGYDAVKESFKDGIRHLKEVKLWDVSPVTFAANPEAVVLSVKGATTFDDLPLADREREWDAAMAERRVRAWAGGENINWDKYRRAFFWYDEDNPELFGSYKLGFADVINGRLTAIPRGIFAAAGAMRGARGGVQIPAKDKQGVINHINRYYEKMAVESPFKADDIMDKGDNMNMADELKYGRVLSSAALEKIKAALEALQALLEQAEREAEPDTTQPSKANPEAAEIDELLKTLRDDGWASEVKEAEAKIENILKKIRG